jgi:hypothetical protein
VLFRFGQRLGGRGNPLRRWGHVVSPCKLFTGKAQNLSRTSDVSTRALAIVSLEQKIKRHIILSHCLVGIINGVLVAPAYFTSCNRSAQRVRGRFGRSLYLSPSRLVAGQSCIVVGQKYSPRVLPRSQHMRLV